MRRWLLVLALVLAPIAARAADTGGPIFRNLCTQISAPVTGRVLCWEESTQVLRYWDGVTWDAITGASTGVTSLTGTPKQIVAAPSTGAVTLSLPTTLIAPGSVEGELRDRGGAVYDVVAYPGVDPTGATPSTVGIRAVFDVADFGSEVLFSPGTYVVSGGGDAIFTIARNVNIRCVGATIIAVPGTVDTSIFKYAVVDNGGNADVRGQRFKGCTVFFVGTGKNALWLSSEGGALPQFGFDISGSNLSGGGNGAAIRVEPNFAATYIHDNPAIAEGIEFTRTVASGGSDGQRVSRNVIFGLRCAVTLDMEFGTYSHVVEQNFLVTRDGAVCVTNGSQIKIRDNQAEQVGVNASARQAQIAIEGTVDVSYSIEITGNNLGGGTNVQRAIYLHNAQNTRIEDNDINTPGDPLVSGTGIVLDSTSANNVIGPVQRYRGSTPFSGWVTNAGTGNVVKATAAGLDGIGTLTPVAKLDVRGSGGASSLWASFGNADFDGAAVGSGVNVRGGATSGITHTAVQAFAAGAPAAISLNPFGRGVGFGGVTNPTAHLHLGAGTTVASTGPLKFTSGSLLTTPEVGDVEFLTDAWYGTITTGAARKTFAFLQSPAFVTPNLGTPSAGVLTNATGLPLTTGVTGVLPIANGGTNDTGTGWTVYTPTVTCAGGGTITTLGTVGGRSKTLGKTRWIQIRVDITTIGSCAHPLSVSLPSTAGAGTTYMLTGREAVVNGKTFVGAIDGAASVALLFNYDNTFVGASGVSLRASGVYEDN